MNTYKYLPPERISFLTDGLLRFSQPDAFNDPFECIPVLSIEDTNKIFEAVIAEKEATITRRADRVEFRRAKSKMLAELKAKPGTIRDFFFQQGTQRINAFFGILCLSKRWDSQLMWAHYSASHTGFCVGFHRDSSFFRGDGGEQPGLREVRYSKERIKVSLERGKAIDFNVMFTKSPDWAYEQEERMLFQLKDAKKVLNDTPYNIHLFELPRAAISEVIMGARANNNVTEHVLKFCSDHGVSAFRAQVSDADFDMLRVSV